MNDQEAYLLFKIEKGLKGLGFWDKKEYQERWKKEFSDIAAMGFAGYFLVVADFMNWAKSQDLPCGPGRGSAAGSLVAYALDITEVDPIKWNLVWERFLNRGRVSLPDVDSDFSQRRRDEVLQYVIDKYGASSVCQIGTIGTMQSRLAVKDVGRTLGVLPIELNRFSSLIPEELRGGQGDHGVTLKQCLK